jgi:hypothetical protein
MSLIFKVCNWRNFIILLVFIEIKIITATYMIIPSGTKLVPADPELIPSHQELVPSHPELVPSHPEFVPSHQEFVPSHLEFVPSHLEFNPSDKKIVPSDMGCVPGISILSLQILMTKSTNRKIGMIYRNTGQYNPARLVPDIFSTVHVSKHKFHLRNYVIEQ